METLKAYSINKISFNGLKKDDNSIPVILLMGPPLSGKGTISEEISKRNNIPAISVGAILRKNIQDKVEIVNDKKLYIGEITDINNDFVKVYKKNGRRYLWNTHQR